MHTKTDSEATSVDTSWPPRSPPRSRPVYYVQSPSNHDVEKMSYGSSPTGSPPHHYYHSSPIHHSRESSTSRFSASLKNPRNLSAYKHVEIHREQDNDDEIDGDDGPSRNVRLVTCGVLAFVLLFTAFSLILWGASKSYPPKILVKNIVFESFNIQAGSDGSGVPTDMLSLNSTVKIHYQNPATFFAVHVTATPFQLHYFQLLIASGQMKKFTQPRKTRRTINMIVKGHQVPLYGGLAILTSSKDHLDRVQVPLNLTVVVRSRAYILGKLVKSKFFGRIRCLVTLNGNKLGHPLGLADSCHYH